jgi:hypothetical protein
MAEELPEFLIDKEYIRNFVNECEYDKKHGLNKKCTGEGERIAKAFRSLFPDVSDKDLGTIILTFTKAFSRLSSTPAYNFSRVLDEVTSSYGYAAADILGTVLAIDDLTS